MDNIDLDEDLLLALEKLPPFLSLSQVAIFLKIHRTTLSAEVKKAGLPVKKKGSKIIISRRVLINYLRARSNLNN